MTPDLSSPAGFLLGFLGLVGSLAFVYALYSIVHTRRIRSSGTDQLAHELSRIATALEHLVLQRQDASKSQPHLEVPSAQPTSLASTVPLKIPNPGPGPDEAKQEQAKEGSQNSGTIPLSMFGRGRK